MEDAIRCPRCSVAMEPYVRATPRGDVTAEMCLSCGGVWLDGAGVTAVYPGLAVLPQSSSDAIARPLSLCPRCGDMPIGFRFFEVELDHCPSCHGLWVDGDELADLARTGDRTDGRSHTAPLLGYRENASSAVTSKTLLCRRCQLRMALDAAVMTADGPHCASCAEQRQSEQLDRELASYVVPKTPLLALPKLEGLASLLGLALDAVDDR